MAGLDCSAGCCSLRFAERFSDSLFYPLHCVACVFWYVLDVMRLCCGDALVPQHSLGGGRWREMILHSFGYGNDGYIPESTLIFGPDGQLYGTTASGGTVFEVAP
jgi:hypothetical protein